MIYYLLQRLLTVNDLQRRRIAFRKAEAVRTVVLVERDAADFVHVAFVECGDGPAKAFVTEALTDRVEAGRSAVWLPTPEAKNALPPRSMCIRMCMRTNIVLDDKLLQEAFKYSREKTKKALVETALKEFVENHRRMDMRDLRGKISFHKKYDYKSMR